MRRLSLSSASDRAWLYALREESLDQSDVVAAVDAILADVKARGDQAVIDATRRFDGVAVSALRLSDDAVRAAAARCDATIVRVLEDAARNIRAFHAPQRPRSYSLQGGRLRQRVLPLDVVGLYVPGGRAAYPSTVLMTALPAKVAGVARVCVATPPAKDGSIPPAIAAACVVAGVDDVYAMGGAQAIAAFAYGTATVPKVDKVCGPGNAYVAVAKAKVHGRVGVDMFAGPSEVLVFDDGRGDARRIAWDLLAQAEHDPKAIPLCLTTSKETWDRLPEVVADELEREPNPVAAASVRDRGAVVFADDVEQAIAFVNELAPEHLEWMADPALVDRVVAAGAIFVGDATPEPVGDYYAGPNHTLPTGGTARFASGLSVHDFVRRQHVVAWDAHDLARHGADIAALARAEGLVAHARSVEKRLADVRPAAPRVVDPASFVLDAVRRQKAYVLEAPPQAPIKLNQNEASTEIGAELKRALFARLATIDLRRYPPFDPAPLTKRIAQVDGWREDGVLVGNGSNELLVLLFRSVVGAGETVVRPDPCFSLYPLHLDVSAAAQVPLKLSLQDDFAYDEDALVSAARAAKVVLLGSPNNPTGSVVAPRVVQRLLDETNALVVVDEAYREFAGQDLVPLLREDRPLVLLRTFSKAMGLASMRFGYLLGPPSLCRELHKVILPYGVSALTQEAALFLLENKPALDALVEEMRAERPRLAAMLRRKGRRVVEGGANFVLMSSDDPKAEFRRLLDHGLLVRDLSSAVPGFLRISVGTADEHRRLEELL